MRLPFGWHGIRFLGGRRLNGGLFLRHKKDGGRYNLRVASSMKHDEISAILKK
jgi:hypothetical protein